MVRQKSQNGMKIKEIRDKKITWHISKEVDRSKNIN